MEVERSNCRVIGKVDLIGFGDKSEEGRIVLGCWLFIKVGDIGVG